MKKYGKFIFCLSLFILSVLFISCGSTMQIQNMPQSLVLDNSSNVKNDMDFIGFKVDPFTLSTTVNENHPMSEFENWKASSEIQPLKYLGLSLQNSGIAKDKSSTNNMNFVTLDLENYKADSKYLSFIDIKNYNLFVKEGSSHTVNLVLGAIMTGLGASFLSSEDLPSSSGACFLIGGIPNLLLGFFPQKTEMKFNSNFIINIYDTQLKKIVYSESMIISKEDTFTGGYFDSGTNKGEVTKYYATLAYNEILKKYASINEKFFGNKMQISAQKFATPLNNDNVAEKGIVKIYYTKGTKLIGNPILVIKNGGNYQKIEMKKTKDKDYYVELNEIPDSVWFEDKNGRVSNNRGFNYDMRGEGTYYMNDGPTYKYISIDKLEISPSR